jgi:hypothetical protein
VRKTKKDLSLTLVPTSNKGPINVSEKKKSFVLYKRELPLEHLQNLFGSGITV